MDRMFRVLSFWTLVIALMATVGQIWPLALLFYGKTVFFLTLGYFGLSERTYLTVFNTYMVLTFVVFIYWIFFQIPLTGPVS